jgi:ACR3 family arsenite efflux pump ArsB
MKSLSANKLFSLYTMLSLLFFFTADKLINTFSIITLIFILSRNFTHSAIRNKYFKKQDCFFINFIVFYSYKVGNYIWKEI